MEHPALLLIIEGSLQQNALVFIKLERKFQFIQIEVAVEVDNLRIPPETGKTTLSLPPTRGN